MKVLKLVTASYLVCCFFSSSGCAPLVIGAAAVATEAATQQPSADGADSTGLVSGAIYRAGKWVSPSEEETTKIPVDESVSAGEKLRKAMEQSRLPKKIVKRKKRKK